MLPNFVSYTLLRAEINVRASTIIGAVGGGGIGEVFRLAIGRDHAAKTYAIIIPAVPQHRRHRPVLKLAAPTPDWQPILQDFGRGAA